MLKVEGKSEVQPSVDPQGQVNSSAAAASLQDSGGDGGMVLSKDVTAHGLSKNLNSVF